MSSREDRGRYRGRRRAPTPPRSRYAAVVTTAFLGAGVVVLGAAAALPDNSTDPAALAAANASGLSAADLADRSAAQARAARSDDRAGAVSTVDQIAPDIWLLPANNYTVSSPFGLRWNTLHPGTDLALAEGTPFFAAHAGTVVLARSYGGYGMCIEIDTGNGITTVYGHASSLLVHEGQKVDAGQVIGLVGNTGFSFGPHLHFEVRQGDKAIDPVPFMLTKGVDILNKSQAVDS